MALRDGVPHVEYYQRVRGNLPIDSPSQAATKKLAFTSKKRRKILASPVDIKSMSEYSLLSKKLLDKMELRDRATKIKSLWNNANENTDLAARNCTLSNLRPHCSDQRLTSSVRPTTASGSLWFNNSGAGDDFAEPDRKQRCDNGAKNHPDQKMYNGSLESMCSDYSSENFSELTSSSDDSEEQSTSQGSRYESPDLCFSSQPFECKSVLKKDIDEDALSKWKIRDPGLVTMTLDAAKLRHVTSLNVSRNQLTTLDVSSLASLRVLVCPHNSLTHLAVHGALLTQLDAAHNELATLETRYPPRQLIDFNMASNHLSELPHWLELCGDLKVLDASRNRITKLADWIPLPNIVNLALHHNKLTQLPEPKTLPRDSQINATEQRPNTSLQNGNSTFGSDQESLPPPTPPRMTNLCPPNFSINSNSTIRERNQLLKNSLQNNRQFLNKRPVPPPPPPHMGTERAPSPPPLPPPPQFFLRGDSYRPALPKVDPPKYLPSMPPPVPALPPHLRASIPKDSSPNSKSPGSLLKENVEEGYYEECGKGKTGDDVEYDLEILLLHHNRLKIFPVELMQKLGRLRVLNVSNNQLVKLPISSKRPTNSTADIVDFPAFSFSGTCDTPKTMLDNLEEFYGGCNSLTSLEALEHCKQLRVLHVAYNELTTVSDRLAEHFPQLEELVVAGNHLQNLPEGVANLKCLRLLRLNCNPLSQLPHLSSLPGIKVVDASHCRLGELRLSDTIAPSLAILDVAENPALSVDPQHVNLCRTRGSVSVVDARKDRLCPLQQTRPPPEAPNGKVANTPSGLLPLGGWSAGFAECIGRKERQLRIPDFNGDGRSALFGLVEEAPSEEGSISPHDSSKLSDKIKPQIPASLEESKQPSMEATSINEILSEFPDVFKEDLNTEEEHAMKYSMLTVLRKQLLHGRALPAGFCAVHLEGPRQKVSASRADQSFRSAFQSAKLLPQEEGSSRASLRLKAGGCGETTAMLVSRSSRPVLLTEEFTKGTCKEVHLEAAGGCCQLVPDAVPIVASALPDPSMASLELTPDTQALVMASRGLWEVMEPHEVNQICLRTAEPSLAARRLLTLAQSYGAQDALSIMVVAITFPEIVRSQPQRCENLENFQATEVISRNGKFDEVSNERKSFKSIPSREESNSKGTREGSGQRLPKKSVLSGEKIEAQIHNEKNGCKMHNYQQSCGPKKDIKKQSPKKTNTIENKLESPNMTISERNESLPPEKPGRLRNTVANDQNERNVTNGRFQVLKSGPRSDFLGILDKVTSTSNLPLPNPYNPSSHDRSSPSGQSFSDLSIMLGEDDTNVEDRKPMWPGQLGPVAPSGPFALDLNKNDQDSTDGPVEDFRSPSMPLDRRNHSYEPEFKRDRMSIRSSADSFASNSTKTTRTGVESLCSSQRSSARNASVPVFRPFYHFPSPDSIIFLNKSNSGDTSRNRPCCSRSSNGDSSERGSFISRKMRPFQKLLRSHPSTITKSLSALSENGGISDSEISDLSSISKLCSNIYGSESEQVSAEQLRGFEYVLAKNAKMVYLKDLDTTSELKWLTKQKRKDLLQQQRYEIERELFLRHALSVPDLVEAQRRLEECLQDSNTPNTFRNERTDEEQNEGLQDKLRSPGNEDPNSRLREGNVEPKLITHFQRSTARKSRFGRGTVRILQNRLASASNKLNSLQRANKSNNKNCNIIDRNFTTSSASTPFRRYGSLQNLKFYQGRNTDNPNKSKSGNFSDQFHRSGSIGSLQSLSANGLLHQGASTEMQERRTLDSAELESRMNQYWQSSTTCF